MLIFFGEIVEKWILGIANMFFIHSILHVLIYFCMLWATHFNLVKKLFYATSVEDNSSSWLARSQQAVDMLRAPSKVSPAKPDSSPRSPRGQHIPLIHGVGTSGYAGSKFRPAGSDFGVIESFWSYCLIELWIRSGCSQNRNQSSPRMFWDPFWGR